MSNRSNFIKKQRTSKALVKMLEGDSLSKVEEGEIEKLTEKKKN
jgi:hypothetical protein